ncbi:hypothetical protein LZC95_22790 [Pendulispora brunnea]|uniref:Uncharacterized protein n=1 Tax=Pendulispora brunnea TaxID=2905690 RepID=A0ABZ2KLU3_9BACT
MTFAPYRNESETEAELAAELLEIQSEEELDHFIPLLLPALKLAAPLLGKVAGPLFKGLAGKALPFLQGGRRRRRPPPQDQFLGKIIGGLFGELEAENEEEEQFLGKILGGLLGQGEVETREQEQFLGKILGGLFGEVGDREVQEQFLGGIFKRLFGGRELEAETGAPGQPEQRARRFVRLARRAARRAGLEIASRLEAGHRLTEKEARKIVLRAIVQTSGRPGHAPNGRGTHAGHAGHTGRATWVRQGDRLIFTM